MSVYWPTDPRLTSEPANSGATGMRAPLAAITTRFRVAPNVTIQMPRRRRQCQTVHATIATRPTRYAYCTPATPFSGVSSAASRTTTAASTSHGHRNLMASRLVSRPPVSRPKTRPRPMASRKSNRYSAASREAAPARTFTPTGSAASSIRNPGE